MLLLDPTNFNASDSEESLLPDERDSFADATGSVQSPGQKKAGLQVSEMMKQKAKEQALKGLNRPLDRKLNELGSKAGFSPEALSGLSKDTPENRERLKEEAKERAKKFSNKAGQRLEQKLAGKGGAKLGQAATDIGKGARAAQEARTAANVAKGAKAAANVAKGAKVAAAGAKTAAVGVKGVQGAIAVAGVASGPETLGLGTVVAFLLNIAISLGISDAIDCLFEIKAGNKKKAIFHAIKAATLIVMFLYLLITLILCLSVIGLLVGAPLLLLLNIYVILGLFYPGVPQLQGLSRKWEIAIIVLLDAYAIVMVITIFAGILYGVCTQTTIGSLLGYGGVIGDAINYVDTNYGTGGYLAGLNQACASITKF